MPREFNEQELMDRVDDDIEFLEETVSFLAEDSPPLLEEVRRSAAAGDAEALTRSAHALKGMFSNFSAGPATDAAGALEKMGRGNQLSEVKTSVDALEEETSRLCDALRKFLQTKSQ